MSIQQTDRQAMGLARGVGNLLQGVDSALNVLSGAPSYWDQLRPASWRGIAFAVLEGRARFGRRNAVHEYPYRDTPWAEDLGRATRRFQVRGFLLGDDVIAQRDRLVAEVEKIGDGELVHPTFGKKSVSLLSFEVQERWNEGRYFEILFEFIESGKRQFPVSKTSTSSAVSAAALAAGQASAADFLARAVADLQKGTAVAEQLAADTARWASRVVTVVDSVAGVIGRIGSYAGVLGRFNLSGLGFLSLGAAANTGASTLQELAGAGSAARVALSAASISMSSAASVVGADAGSINAYSASAQSFAAAASAAAATPADAMRVMSGMAGFQASYPVIDTAVGQSIADISQASAVLFNGAAVIGLAQASAAYQPVSANDAAAVRDAVTQALDAQITQAGDGGLDATYSALVALRAAVVQDMSRKGAALPAMVEVVSRRPVPSLVLAQRLYRDPARADELVMEADPVHPAFMPVRFMALSA